MKKTILLLLALGLLIPQMSHAQAAILAAIFGDQVASEEFNLSLEAGLPFNTVSNVVNSSYATGLNFGIAGNIKLSERWFLSPTAYFVSKRSFNVDPLSLNTPDDDLNSFYEDTNARFTINYIELPLFINYRLPSLWQFGIAPQVAFKQTSTLKYDGEFGDFTEGFGQTLNNTEFGAIFQLGYFFKKARNGKGLHLYARYYQGFTDVFKNTYANGSNKASYFSIHLAVPFITEELAAKNRE